MTLKAKKKSSIVDDFAMPALPEPTLDDPEAELIKSRERASQEEDRTCSSHWRLVLRALPASTHA